MDLFDWAKPISKNDEERVNDLMSHFFFGPITKDVLRTVPLTYRKNRNCPTPMEEFFDEPEKHLWLINQTTNEIYGICKIIDDSFGIGEYRFIYVDVRCTFNTTSDDYITSGRLLWSYILNHCFKVSPKFVVYNFSTPQAKGYHLKMGMKPYAESEDIQKILNEEDVVKLPQIKEDIQEYPDAAKELSLRTVSEITSTNDAGGSMFYVSNPRINYNNIYDIIMSLPLSETMMRKGGKKYKRKSSKKQKRNRTTIKKKKRNHKTKIYEK